MWDLLQACSCHNALINKIPNTKRVVYVKQTLSSGSVVKHGKYQKIIFNNSVVYSIEALIKK